MLTVGQSFISSATDYYNHSIAMGYWAPYLAEPRPPVVQASDGDYQDVVVVEWFVEGDRTGPPVTSDMVTIFRNDYVLTQTPLSQTQYLDYNVFPGEYYTYGITTSNDMGESHRSDNVGYLNANGVITGSVATPSGNPVIDTKIKLIPNMGRSAKFNGNNYIYYFDESTSANRLFGGLAGDYSIETWFRSVHTEQQTIFAAVDSATANHYVLIELTEAGKVRWQHSAVAGGDGTELVSVDPYTQTGDESDWHHLALVYDSGDMTMYIDGALIRHTIGGDAINDNAEIILGKRSPISPHLYLTGRLDDFRIWSTPRAWADIRKYMDLTLSGEEYGLAAYWKFDEAEGETIFDMTDGDIDGNICGIEHDALTAPVFVGALTDTTGNYIIRGIYYGSGTVFAASPSKETSIGRSIIFDGEDDYVSFQAQRVDVTTNYTMEGWFKTVAQTEQTMFAAVDPSDGNHRFSIGLTENGEVEFRHFESSIISSESYNNELWHHYAVSFDGSNASLILYVDGENEGEISSDVVIPNHSEIVIGREAPDLSANYFDGWLDEFRLWDLTRTAEQVTGTMNQSLESDNYGLANYWRMNDGVDVLVTDATENFVTGTIQGSEGVWTEDIPLNEVYHHFYEPESRNVTLNNSNTSVDFVNFTDESLIPISGYVRYENTACFQEGVEILLNGESFIPPIRTDSDGKFIFELEPGSRNNILTPVFEDHEFLPPLIELPMIVQPIAGIFFDDKTTYKVDGYVAGGSCKFPITPSQGQITVTFSAVNGCIERTVIPNEETGMYESTDLPPLVYNLTVNHPDPNINEFFVGDTISLADSDRERDFIYRAPPMVEFIELPESEYESEDFPLILKQREIYQAAFEVYEPYGENRCMIQSFDMEVFDNISDTSYAVQLEGEGVPHIQFTGKAVNLLSGGEHPYQNNLQIVVMDSLGRSATTNLWAFIEGDQTIPGVNFSTTTSKMPWYVLRVPPGDGSTTYMTSDQTICYTTSTSNSIEHAGHMNNTLHLGTDQQIVTTAGLGVQVGIITEIGVKFDIGANFSWSATATNVNETCNCLTTSETYSTSGDGITGDDATVFIGGGHTVDMGLAHYLWYDSTDATVKIDTVITVNTTGVTSTYMHSKYYVENVLMPDLWEIYIINDDEDALANYNYWQGILDQDSIAIANAIPNAGLMVGADGEASSNISFDAGASLEYSYSTEVSNSISNTVSFTNAQEFFMETGFDIMGAGWDLNVGYARTSTAEVTETTDATLSRTIGFVLDDDDPGDGFAFTVKSDPYWGMPVFDLIGGQSSCPWEAGTVKRQLASISSTENLIVDVPPDEPALFTLLLGNSSETGEPQTYGLSVLSETNPDGAFLAASGAGLAGGVDYEIEAGTQIEVTASVYRGSDEYNYDGITLQFAPPCEDEIAGAFGSGTEPQNTSFIELSVHFQEPCSESNIASPEDGWLLDSSHDSDTLWVTVDGYTFPPDSFTTNIDLQYRSAAGGDWFTAYSVSTDTLIDDFVLMPFNISPSIIIDGEYELRSQAQCTGGKYPGTSLVSRGLIDRSPPMVLGLPEPVDGILGPDDLIRVTLNEDVACGEISPGAGDIMLFNTETGNPMDYTYTCGYNMITFEPNVQNTFIENQIFRAEIHNLQDSYGNTRATDEPIVWEFYVNRNPIEWTGTNIDNVVMYVDEEYSTTRQLENNGGSNRSWTMIGGREGAIASGEPLDLPAWLNITPTEGTLTPGSSQDISISLVEGLNFGEHSTTLYAAGTMGDEPLIVDIRKLCYEPQWAVDATDFQYSMNITANLLTDGELSDDVYDQIGVFVGDELRGVAELIYMEGLADMPNIHPYELFLTPYSNMSSGEELSFRVWDASECRELGWIEEYYTFEANAVYGTPTNPETISATSKIISNMAFSDGWNWISMNLFEEDMSLNSVTQFMNLTGNDLIKDQTSFSMYVDGFDWVGTLDTIRNESMYQLKIAESDTLMFVGYEVDPELDTIAVSSGWNWIGYLPQVSYPVDYAL
ncbi:MAG: LamG domain-containing protein, partial [Candidatus Marinimicrobia bacterium]|nr:LamG domain-containing protein [Candidatus Neomarinimicrobiota bacterium]